MKKILLSLIALVSINIAIAQNCTADPQYTAPGVYPDSATGLAPAIVGVPYAETITTITPVDTCIVIVFPPCTTVPIDSVVIDNFTGLPPGFSVVSENQNGLNFVFLGGTASCMLITGTASAVDVGNWPLTVSGLSWATVLGVPTSQPFNVDYYSIDIVMPSGVESFSGNEFEVRQNIPNPFNNTSEIEFYLPQENNVSISIYNVLGKPGNHDYFIFQMKSEIFKRGPIACAVDSDALIAGLYKPGRILRAQTPKGGIGI